jgi:hypothetical protein
VAEKKESQRSSGGSADAIEAQDPIEPDSADEQATDEAAATGGTSTEVVEAVEEPDPEPDPDAPTGGQSFDYGRRPWEE